MTANNPTLDVAAGAAAYTVRIRGSTSGDMWIVRAVSDRNSSWRALGEWHAAESSHLALLPREDGPLNLHATLLWSTPVDLSSPWDFGPPNSTVSACENNVRGCEASASPSCDDGVQARCFATPAAPLSTAAADSSAPFLRSSESAAQGGRWTQDLGGWPRWQPFGRSAAEEAARSEHRAGCLAAMGARQRLLLLGDSVMRGSFYDLCVLVGGACARLTQLSADATTWTTANGTFGGGVPDVARVLFAEALGCDAGVACGPGLANVLSAAPLWEALIVNASRGVDALTVVINSGLHDLASSGNLVTFLGSHHPSAAGYARQRELVLARYEERMCALVALLERARAAAAPARLTFVWKATCAQPLVAEHESRYPLSRSGFDRGTQTGAGACARRGHPGTLPLVITALNAVARRHFSGRAGFHFWGEPYLYSFSAPSAAFCDAAHHDACAHASARSHLPKKVLGNCLKYRMRGIPAYNAKDARNFWNNGGLSEAITLTLGRFVCRAGDT